MGSVGSRESAERAHVPQHRLAALSAPLLLFGEGVSPGVRGMLGPGMLGQSRPLSHIPRPGRAAALVLCPLSSVITGPCGSPAQGLFIPSDPAVTALSPFPRLLLHGLCFSKEPVGVSVQPPAPSRGGTGSTHLGEGQATLMLQGGQQRSSHLSLLHWLRGCPLLSFAFSMTRTAPVHSSCSINILRHGWLCL